MKEAEVQDRFSNWMIAILGASLAFLTANNRLFRVEFHVVVLASLLVLLTIVFSAALIIKLVYAVLTAHLHDEEIIFFPSGHGREPTLPLADKSQQDAETELAMAIRRVGRLQWLIGRHMPLGAALNRELDKSVRTSLLYSASRGLLPAFMALIWLAIGASIALLSAVGYATPAP